MRTRTSNSAQQGQAIDLTPMLDVVFIMLIFFIVTASFIKLPGVEVSKVDANTADPYKKVGILVAVSGNNEFWIDKKRVETTALKLNLTRLFNDNPKGGMVIQADNESNIESVAKVADIAQRLFLSISFPSSSIKMLGTKLNCLFCIFLSLACFECSLSKILKILME